MLELFWTPKEVNYRGAYMLPQRKELAPESYSDSSDRISNKIKGVT